jgi:very-short-patch-repair endonuclease
MFRNRPAFGSTQRARRFRSNATDAKRRMWRILRHCFPEVRFRRQAPLLAYTVDFCSHRAKLVIEVDGGQHLPAKDLPRTRAIESEGYRIIRFWNHDVLGNGDGVASAIDLALHSGHPHATLPDQGGGEGALPWPD